MDIEITFINQSDDPNNTAVVIFQKNVAEKFETIAIAWRVIENIGRNWRYKFRFPMDFYVSARDSWGNISDLQLAVTGQKWNVVRSTLGDILTLDPTGAPSFSEVEIKNCLSIGSIDALVFKDGKLMASKTGLSPQQKAVFEFKPTIWVGVVSGIAIAEGDVMNPAILSDINTEISLLGITKADLIMTGDGATPFKFTLVPRE